MSACPVCANQVKLPTGDIDSKILIVFDKQFESPKRSNDISALSVFRTGLRRIGLGMADCRVCYLRNHEEEQDECYDVEFQIVKGEMENKKLIILCGADTVSTFTDYGIMDVNGLPFDLDGITIFPIISPNTLFVQGKGIGEFEFAMKNLETILGGLQ